MAYNLVVKEEARIEMLEAYRYYEQQKNGLGDVFLLELQRRFDSIAEHPEYYSFIDNKQLLRDVVVDNFPYVIIYAVVEQEVRVYSVFLTHRLPGH